MYGLNERSRDDAARFISWRAMNLAVRPHLHEKSWEPLLGNKWIFSMFYTALDVPLPETYGFLHPVSGRTLDGSALRDVRDLGSWCERTGTTAFVAKPIGGNQSRGVAIVADVRSADVPDGPRFVMVDGRSLDVDGLQAELVGPELRGLTGHVIQERIVAHPVLGAINAGGPHNLRVLTATMPDGGCEVQAATLRISRAGSGFDAWNRGGIAADVDPRSGEVRRAMTKSKSGSQLLLDHPDTGERLVGVVIPLWEEVCDAVLDAARKTPGIRVVGWDVVVAADGPRIIEGNFDWDLQLMQAPADGFLGTEVSGTWAELGADLPDGSLSWRWRYRRRPLVAAVRRVERRVSR